MSSPPLRTCVSPDGRFVFGIHKPAFHVDNLRENDYIAFLGKLEDGTTVENHVNFPGKDVDESGADSIYEIPNAFPFRGTTYINSRWAETKAGRTETISIPKPESVSLSASLKKWLKSRNDHQSEPADFFSFLPRPLLIALADTSTDPQELATLAGTCCHLLFDDEGVPSGLMFRQEPGGKKKPDINDHILFEVIVNNPNLPDSYKRAMVLRPGVQGESEITGEWLGSGDGSHVFEYLRRNSYIPWGHFAANTADDTVRYRAADLLWEDMAGMRHLYYQRTYVRLAREMDISMPSRNGRMSAEQMEKLRLMILDFFSNHPEKKLFFNSSLWGWNFGFGYAQSGYRLHASHQQIHQQYAMIPVKVESGDGGLPIDSYACGDMVGDFIRSYRASTGKNFFQNYVKAIRSNKRIDRRWHLPAGLEIFEDDNVLLFVPKAQTSQWEVQLMPLRPCGNILEADSAMRNSLDRAILLAVQILEKMGAKMVTSIEYSKRFDDRDADQQLLYAFLPRLPESPGAFSEAQLRWINGHYPEDFAAACRAQYLS